MAMFTRLCRQCRNQAQPRMIMLAHPRQVQSEMKACSAMESRHHLLRSSKTSFERRQLDDEKCNDIEQSENMPVAMNGAQHQKILQKFPKETFYTKIKNLMNQIFEQFSRTNAPT